MKHQRLPTLSLTDGLWSSGPNPSCGYSWLIHSNCPAVMLQVPHYLPWCSGFPNERHTHTHTHTQTHRALYWTYLIFLVVSLAFNGWAISPAFEHTLIRSMAGPLPNFHDAPELLLAKIYIPSLLP
jgi:hypothetical protein